MFCFIKFTSRVIIYNYYHLVNLPSKNTDNHCTWYQSHNVLDPMTCGCGIISVFWFSKMRKGVEVRKMEREDKEFANSSQCVVWLCYWYPFPHHFETLIQSKPRSLKECIVSYLLHAVFWFGFVYFKEKHFPQKIL